MLNNDDEFETATLYCVLCVMPDVTPSKMENDKSIQCLGLTESHFHYYFHQGIPNRELFWEICIFKSLPMTDCTQQTFHLN